VYENLITWPSVAMNDDKEMNALKAALALAQMLGRIVILPRFHCSKSAAEIGGDMGGPWTARGRGDRRPHPPSTVPPTPTHQCPLNCLLNMTAFDTQFDGFYRESSFLRHPLVPAAVREDRSPPQDVNRRPPKSPDAREAEATGAEVSEGDVVQMFGSLPHHTLVFRSLYHVEPRFSGVDEQRTFDSRVRKAFHRGTYRQL